MSLLYFIENIYGIGPPTDRLGEVSAFLVPDVTGRADQARNRVFLHVFRHVWECGPSRVIVEKGTRQVPMANSVCLLRWGPGRSKSPSGAFASCNPALALRIAGLGDRARARVLSEHPLPKRSSMWISL